VTGITLLEAQANLSQLVERAVAGEDIVIAEAGQPLVRLVPLAKQQVSMEPRKLGQFADVIQIGDDFDDPLPDDIQRAFDGEMP
jgi:prevent-host-death family protein